MKLNKKVSIGVVIGLCVFAIAYALFKANFRLTRKAVESGETRAFAR